MQLPMPSTRSPTSSMAAAARQAITAKGTKRTQVLWGNLWLSHMERAVKARAPSIRVSTRPEFMPPKM